MSDRAPARLSRREQPADRPAAAIAPAAAVPGLPTVDRSSYRIMLSDTVPTATCGSASDAAQTSPVPACSILPVFVLALPVLVPVSSAATETGLPAACRRVLAVSGAQTPLVSLCGSNGSLLVAVAGTRSRLDSLR